MDNQRRIQGLPMDFLWTVHGFKGLSMDHPAIIHPGVRLFARFLDDFCDCWEASSELPLSKLEPLGCTT